VCWHSPALLVLFGAKPSVGFYYRGMRHSGGSVKLRRFAINCMITVFSAMIVVFSYPYSYAMAANGASAPFFVMAPIRVNGHLRYSISTLFPVTAAPPSTSTPQIMEASVHARTRAYIWQPWFMQLAARLGFVVARTMADKNTNGLDLTGRGDLNFLPRSRYPFHAYIEQQTQSPDDALFGIERLVTRYGADASYMTRRGGLYLLTYDASLVNNRSSITNQNSYDTFSDQLTGEVFMRRPGNDVRIRANFRREKQDELEQAHWGRSINLAHRFQPSRSLDMNSLASYDHSVDKSGPSYISSKFSQVTSSFFWRPYKKPWSIFGSVIGSQSKSENVTSNTAAASLGARAWIEHTDKWRSQFSANAAKAKDSKSIFTQGISSSYSNRVTLPIFNYNQNFNAGATNRMREGESSQNYRASGSHSLNRSIPFFGGKTSFNLGQVVSETYATENRVLATTLRHTASIGWGSSTAMSSTQMALSASTSHRWGSVDRKGNSQLFNFQMSRRQTLTRYSKLTANMTAQAIRLNTLLEGSEGYSGSFTGTVDYRHVRFLNVPNLRLSSTLSIAAEGVSPSNGVPQNIDLDAWETRLDYFFGKITSSLLLRITGAEGDYFGSVTFNIARRFG